MIRSPDIMRSRMGMALTIQIHICGQIITMNPDYFASPPFVIWRFCWCKSKKRRTCLRTAYLSSLPSRNHLVTRLGNVFLFSFSFCFVWTMDCYCPVHIQQIVLCPSNRKDNKKKTWMLRMSNSNGMGDQGREIHFFCISAEWRVLLLRYKLMQLIYTEVFYGHRN